MSFSHPISRYKKYAAIIAVAALLAGGALWFFKAHRPVAPLSPNVTTPVFAVEALDSHWLYFTEPAREVLMAKRPDLLEAYNADSDRIDFLRAEQDPGFWRKLDRKYHFDAILLSGDPSLYKNLLEHLIQTKDWVLVYLDHTSLIFKRMPVKGWSLDDFRKLQGRFANYPPHDKAVYLTQSAEKLIIIGQPALAKQQLDESLSLDDKSAETWIQMALLQSQTGKPQEALETIAKALKIDSENAHARATQAQILYSMKRYSDALAITEKLVEETPDDPYILFFHAKIAHEARAYSQEIPTLKHLIDITSEKKQPTAGYRIYLGQAYARDGQANAAVEQFQIALAEGGLSEEQRKFIRETIDQINTRTSM